MHSAHAARACARARALQAEGLAQQLRAHEGELAAAHAQLSEARDKLEANATALAAAEAKEGRARARAQVLVRELQGARQEAEVRGGARARECVCVRAPVCARRA